MAFSAFKRVNEKSATTDCEFSGKFSISTITPKNFIGNNFSDFKNYRDHLQVGFGSAVNYPCNFSLSASNCRFSTNGFKGIPPQTTNPKPYAVSSCKVELVEAKKFACARISSDIKDIPSLESATELIMPPSLVTNHTTIVSAEDVLLQLKAGDLKSVTMKHKKKRASSDSIESLSENADTMASKLKKLKVKLDSSSSNVLIISDDSVLVFPQPNNSTDFEASNADLVRNNGENDNLNPISSSKKDGIPSEKIVTTQRRPSYIDSPMIVPFADPQYRSNHAESIVRAYAEKRFECQLCKVCFGTCKDYEEHAICHPGHLPFTCSVCGAQFRHACSGSRHIRIKHSNKQNHTFACTFCDYTFVYAYELERHMRTHEKSSK